MCACVFMHALVLVYSEQLDWASQLHAQVCEAYKRLSLAAEERAVKFERCLQLRLFEDNASTVFDSCFFVII